MILCDVDGVIADCSARSAAVLGEAYDPHDWDFGLSKLPARDQEEFWYQFNAPGFCASIRPYPGAVAFVDRLRATGLRVVFLTSPSRGVTWAGERADWLIENFGTSRKDIVQCSDKKLVTGVLIDDKPENLYGRDLQDAILFDRPYNQAAQLFTRVRNYEECLETVRGKFYVRA